MHWCVRAGLVPQQQARPRPKQRRPNRLPRQKPTIRSAEDEDALEIDDAAIDLDDDDEDDIIPDDDDDDAIASDPDVSEVLEKAKDVDPNLDS